MNMSNFSAPSLLKQLSISSLFIFLTPFVAYAQTAGDCSLLTRNLRLGVSGQDVLLLQQLLNNEATTRLASSGAGALGSETTYFGEKTKGAVVRFQNLYANEVLSPVGLTSGSGFVGVYTRAKLTVLCEKSKKKTSVSAVESTSPQTPVASTKAIASPVNTGAPSLSSLLMGNNDYFHVKYPSLYVVHPGDNITVYGGGFTAENNTLRIGALSFGGLKPNLLGTLEATVPANAPLGKFDLWVENAKGSSNKSFLIITRPGTAAPVIDSFTPTVTQVGKTITVNGSGFTKESNEIYLSVAAIRGVASPDGKTLSFIFAVDTPGVTPELIPPGTTRNISTPVSFYIVNANGISNRVTFIVAY